MDLKDVYYHGICPTEEYNVDFYNLNKSYNSLLKIIKDKQIKSLNLQGQKERKSASYADLDKICLCKDLRQYINKPINKFQCCYDAYSMYVLYRYCIILKANMEGVHKPKLWDFSTIKEKSSKNYKELLNADCTNLFDEFRTYYYILLKQDAIAIGVPNFAFYKYYRENVIYSAGKCLDKFRFHLEGIQTALSKSGLDLPIVDTELQTVLKSIDKEYVEMLEEECHKRRILVNL